LLFVSVVVGVFRFTLTALEGDDDDDDEDDQAGEEGE